MPVTVLSDSNGTMTTSEVSSFSHVIHKTVKEFCTMGGVQEGTKLGNYEVFITQNSLLLTFGKGVSSCYMKGKIFLQKLL